MAQGLGNVPLLLADIGQVVVRLGQIGLQGQRSLVMPAGRIDLSQAAQRISQIVVRARQVRLHRQGVLQMAHRGSWLAR